MLLHVVVECLRNLYTSRRRHVFCTYLALSDACVPRITTRVPLGLTKAHA